ncbi:MAG: DNA polymerase I [Alphaproteobacteria bacterium]|nr:DNA polymerase I [Alphaproteobacteria bacterium]
MTSGASPHLFLVDGSGFIFRAFHALPALTRSDGTPVNAVLGFSNMLLKLLTDQEVDHLVVVFDHSRASFRHDLYPDYKANRNATPEELIPQFSLIREACTAFNVPSIEKEGFEADDLIATLAKQACAEGFEVTLVSSDKDLMQLISARVNMWDPIKNRLLGEDAVREKFGVGPAQVVDVQALVGDSSDNIPGVPGIGIKTASQLIQEFGHLDALLERVAEIPQPKRRQSLIDHREDALLSRKLATLEQEVPLDASLSDYKRRPFPAPDLEAFILKNEFKTLFARLRSVGALAEGEVKGSFSGGVQKLETKHQEITTLEALEKWLKDVRRAGSLALFMDHLIQKDFFSFELQGLSLACGDAQSAYIPFKGTSPKVTLFEAAPSDEKGLSMGDVLTYLKPLLEEASLLKIAHDAKLFLQYAHTQGVDPVWVEDTLVMSYCLDGAKHDHTLEALSVIHLGQELEKNAPTTAHTVMRLYAHLSLRLFEEKSLTLYKSMDHPLVAILAAMEEAGVRLDVSQMQALSTDFAVRLEVLEKEIHDLAGKTFNVASSQQLAEVLFKEHGLATGKKGKTGAFSTSADELERLSSEGSVLAEKVLVWRQLAKLKSTYTDALIGQVHPKSGRIHSRFSMTSTSTGRLASSQPNLQNIPIRTQEGRKIRQAFIPEEGYTLVCLDYSQIELRLLAHMAEIPSLRDAFLRGEDIHARTASDVFHVPLDQMTSEIRRRAKAINFGIIYGISAFGLSRQLGIPQSEASAYIKAYYKKYPGIIAFMERIKEEARVHGFVKTLMGRKCFITGIKDANPTRRAFAERQAINAPLQGSAADLIKKAMIKAHAALPELCADAKLILQVHDELVFEVPKDEAHRVGTALKEVMEKVSVLAVPLVVDLGMGQTWDDAHG